MAKLVRTLVTIAVLAGIGIGALVYMKNSRDAKTSAAPVAQQPDNSKKKKDEPPMRTEEKYGFTTETVGGGG